VTGPVREIRVPARQHAAIVDHARRKVEGRHLPGESADRMAFGLLAGTFEDDGALLVRAVLPLAVNLRTARGVHDVMDAVVDEFAVRSTTPNAHRGWVADPREVLAADELCDRNGWVCFGNYHTHRVAWRHDPLRDTCTELDRVLAEATGQWVFVVSVVDLDRPRLRAFHEGRNEAEVPIRLVDAQGGAEGAEDGSAGHQDSTADGHHGETAEATRKRG
jgi:hypothetical protein